MDVEKTSYKKVQFLGCSLSTEHDLKNYSGLANDNEDWKERVSVTKEIIEKINESTKINRNKDCLKLFMLPEFFFRGRKGAYVIETATDIVDSLKKMVQDEKYKDWIFVFGTIASYTYDENIKYTPYYPINFSMIQKGNSLEKTAIVLKERVSGIDYVRALLKDEGKLTLDNVDFPSRADLDEIKKVEQRFSYDGRPIFEMDGIRFGLEICRDNICGRIDNGIEPKDIELDILLVPSYGEKKDELTVSKYLSNRGYLFNVDGFQGGRVILLDKKRNEINSFPSDFSEKLTVKRVNLLDTQANIKIYPELRLPKSKDMELLP